MKSEFAGKPSGNQSHDHKPDIYKPKTKILMYKLGIYFTLLTRNEVMKRLSASKFEPAYVWQRYSTVLTRCAKLDDAAFKTLKKM